MLATTCKFCLVFSYIILASVKTLVLYILGEMKDEGCLVLGGTAFCCFEVPFLMNFEIWTCFSCLTLLPFSLCRQHSRMCFLLRLQVLKSIYNRYFSCGVMNWLKIHWKCFSCCVVSLVFYYFNSIASFCWQKDFTFLVDCPNV